MTKNIGEYSKKIKELQSRSIPFSKTYEVQIFNGSEWYFALEDTGQLEIEAPKASSISNVVKAETIVQPNVLKDKKIVFLGDTFDPNSSQEDLLAKMIQAMKLNPHNQIRLKIDSELETIVNKKHESHPLYKKLVADLESLKPDVIVTLGAAATHLLLNKKEKLSSIHGQIFPIQLNELKTFFCPVFHPDFLVINPNMKRTAWMDLLKVIDFLGKN